MIPKHSTTSSLGKPKPPNMAMRPAPFHPSPEQVAIDLMSDEDRNRAARKAMTQSLPAYKLAYVNLQPPHSGIDWASGPVINKDTGITMPCLRPGCREKSLPRIRQWFLTEGVYMKSRTVISCLVCKRLYQLTPWIDCRLPPPH